MSKKLYGQDITADQGAALRLNIVPQPKAERAREPVTPSRGLVRGQFPSTKMKRMIAWESQLEQKACYCFEFSPAVIAFREQPETLYLPCLGRMYRYTPDFELTFYNGEIWYVEVKPLTKLRSPQVQERLQLANQFLTEKGFHFIVMTDQELNFPNRIRNFLILRPYLRFEISAHTSEQAKLWATNTTDPTFEAFCRFLGFQSLAFALIAQLHIGVDLDQPLSNTSLLFAPVNGDHYHETCFFTYRTGVNFERCSVPSGPDA